MPIPTSVNDLSTVDSSNSPQGGDPVGGNIDDYMRSHAGIIARQFKQGTDIISADTLPIPIDGTFFNVTGSVTITQFANTFNGKTVTLRFMQSMTLVNSSGLILPANANIITQPNDYAIFVQESTNVWRCIFYQNWIKLGSAATADVTTSTTDTVAGHLLKVGDFGVGGRLPVVSGVDILADDNLYQFYGSGLTNTPAGAGAEGYVNKESLSASYRKVTYVPFSGRGPWINVCNNGAWAGWVQVYHTANLPPTQPASTTTAGLIAIASAPDLPALTNATKAATPWLLGQLLGSSVLAANGFVQIPCRDSAGALQKVIFQWMTTGDIAAGGSGSANWPTPFLNAAFGAVATPVGVSPSVDTSSGAIGAISAVGFNIANWGKITTSFRVFAVGW